MSTDSSVEMADKQAGGMTVNPMMNPAGVQDRIPQETSDGSARSFSTRKSTNATGIGVKDSMKRFDTRTRRERNIMQGIFLVVTTGVILLLLAINIDGFCLVNCEEKSVARNDALGPTPNNSSDRMPTMTPTMTPMPTKMPTAMPSSGVTDLSSLLEGVRAPYVNTVPAMTMMVVSSDEILASGQTGTTVACDPTLNSTTNEYDQAVGCGEDVLPSSVWAIGSITKSMTTMLIGECVETASCPLSWTTKLGEILDSAKGSAYENVTIDILTAMRGGFPVKPVSPDNTGFWYYATTGEGLVAQRRAMAEATFQNNTPAMPLESNVNGTVYGYLYSNLGFVVAGHILEKIGNYTTPWEAMISDFWDELNMTSAIIGLPHGLHDASGTVKYQCGSAYCGFSPPKYDYLECALSMNPLKYCLKNDYNVRPDNPPVMSPAGESSMNLTALSHYLQWIMKAQQGYDLPGPVFFETVQYMLSNSTGYPMGGGWTYTHGFVVDYTPCEEVFGETCIYYLGSEGAIWTMQYWMAPKSDRIFIIGTNGDETIGADAALKALQKVAQEHPELL